jgi:hypothetical protein
MPKARCCLAASSLGIVGSINVLIDNLNLGTGILLLSGIASSKLSNRRRRARVGPVLDPMENYAVKDTCGRSSLPSNQKDLCKGFEPNNLYAWNTPARSGW